MTNAINSPCIRNCCLNEEDICLGCFRHIDEITQWNNTSAEQKQQIIELTKARKTAYQLKYRRPNDKPA